MKIGASIVKNNNMKAVHDKDLIDLLQSLGVYENILSGSYHCILCNKEISISNIDSIVPYNNTIQFTCDDLKCHLKLIGWGK